MTSELETELARLRLECKAKDDELNLLRGLVHAMREDLNVKNEQFDFLYTSLQASSQQWGQVGSRIESAQGVVEALALPLPPPPFSAPGESTAACLPPEK